MIMSHQGFEPPSSLRGLLETFLCLRTGMGSGQLSLKGPRLEYLDIKTHQVYIDRTLTKRVGPLNNVHHSSRSVLID